MNAETSQKRFSSQFVVGQIAICCVDIVEGEAMQAKSQSMFMASMYPRLADSSGELS